MMQTMVTVGVVIATLILWELMMERSRRGVTEGYTADIDYELTELERDVGKLEAASHVHSEEEKTFLKRGPELMRAVSELVQRANRQQEEQEAFEKMVAAAQPPQLKYHPPEEQTVPMRVLATDQLEEPADANPEIDVIDSEELGTSTAG